VTVRGRPVELLVIFPYKAKRIGERGEERQ
jgi:hypothetical protein